MKMRLAVMMVLLAIVSLAIGAQSSPQFGITPSVPTMGEPTSFISWFSPSYDIFWSVDNVPVGIGQKIEYVFLSAGTYTVVMEVFQESQLVHTGKQVVEMQYSDSTAITVLLAIFGTPSPPQFDVMPRIPTVGEPTSFISRFSPGYNILWSVNNVPVGTGQTTPYIFPSLGMYSVVMKVSQGSQVVYTEEQVVQTQFSPPGYNPSPPEIPCAPYTPYVPPETPYVPPETPYVPPETPYVPPEIPDIDTGDFSPTSILGLLFLFLGAYLLFLEQ